MAPIIVICFLLTLCYVCLIMAYRWGWAAQEEFKLPDNFVPSTFITVVIPARNEAGNIGPCILSILAQQYPKELFEIIVVDDHCDDDTAAVVEGTKDNRVHCIRLSEHLNNRQINSYKKAALAAGIVQARGALIVTTDADCIMPVEWLKHITAIYEQRKPIMVVAPVIYTSDGSMVQEFQLIDFMSMQGITAAAHKLKLGNMSNGANLAFAKDAYKQVGGYEGIDALASGDDYLLMSKMSRLKPDGIAYLKSANAIVTTTPQPDWRSFLQQRIRWASKSGKYNDTRLTTILLLVYLFNLAFPVVFVVGMLSPPLLVLVLCMFTIKVIVECFFIMPVATFFNRERSLRNFIILQPLHILYIVLAGFLGFIGVYQWKGRRVR